MTEPKKGLTLDEIRLTREFQSLTEKQQLFVSTYIANGFDRAHAVTTAYNVTDKARAQRMSYPLTQNPRIIQVLHMYFGSTPTEAFLEEIDRAIHNRRLTKNQLEALILKSKIMGLSVEFQKYNPSQREQKRDRAEKKAQRKAALRKRKKVTPKPEPKPPEVPKPAVIPPKGDEWV